jgi:ferredoxin-thioredoxin reductase catalytic subunit
MNAEQLYGMLKKAQEPKGYFFHPDKVRVLELMEGMLVNKERYGYMSCPCRLASGQRELDQDIICPCIYREEDVRQYGQCFCGLYESAAYQQNRTDIFVPERRPPEKTVF